MKKVLVGSAVAMVAVSASAQEVKLPTIYGQVNKAIHYVGQKKEQGYSKMTNLVDVKNSESRLGAKGTHEINTLKVNYNLLMGLESSNDTNSVGAGVGRLRIRNAEVSFADAWGTVFGGQTADIASAIGASLDPLSTTFAGTAGYDQDAFINNAVTSIGYLDRSRYDQIGYKTPEWMGLQYTFATAKLAIGQTDDNTLDPATAATEPKQPGTRYNNVVSFKHKMNDMFKMEVYGAYNLYKSAWYKTYNDYLGAVSLTYGEFTLNGEYTKLNTQLVTANAFKAKATMMQASLKWNRGDHTAALTWANKKNELDAKATGDDDELDKHNQIAAGYMYNLNKYVQLRAVYAHYTVKTEAAAANTSPNFKNTADIFSLGTLVTF